MIVMAVRANQLSFDWTSVIVGARGKKRRESPLGPGIDSLGGRSQRRARSCLWCGFRAQSLFEPNTANRPKDSPISRSWACVVWDITSILIRLRIRLFWLIVINYLYEQPSRCSLVGLDGLYLDR